MSDIHVTDITKLTEQLSRFTSFVQQMDGQYGPISFQDNVGFLGREENYKSRIAEDARKELKLNKWTASWIGTGKIAAHVGAAMSKAGNLVNKNQQIDFKNRLNPKRAEFQPEAEQVLYTLYHSQPCDEPTAFANAMNVFGKKYDTIAFLFFIKDSSRFLPISSGHFEKGFAALNIDCETSGKCSWNNYQDFIGIIEEIRAVMEVVLPMQGMPRLIDAHSFVWIIQEDRFINWKPDAKQSIQIEQTAEKYAHVVISGKGGRRSFTSSTFVRSKEVAEETKKRANGICQFCNRPAPFIDKKGNPYLEVHHIIWLSRGGEDSTANTVALCPNCHTRMHILDKIEDAEKLKAVVNKNLQGSETICL